MAQVGIPNLELPVDAIFANNQPQVPLMMPTTQDNFFKIFDPTQQEKLGELDYKSLALFSPVYAFVMEEKWHLVKQYIDKNPSLIMTRISQNYETILHVVASSPKAVWLLEDILKKVPPSLVEWTDFSGNTALHVASRLGNVKAAGLLVNCNPKLLHVVNIYRQTPLFSAAISRNKEMFLYLLDLYKDNFTDERGVTLLIDLIITNHYDMALVILKRRPRLACLKDDMQRSALDTLAENRHGFASGAHFNFWAQIIYNCLPVEDDGDILNNVEAGKDAENPVEVLQESKAKSPQQSLCWSIVYKVGVIIWTIFRKLSPSVNHIYAKKKMHNQAYQLLNYICSQIPYPTNTETRNHLTAPLLTATKLGIYEIVNEILKAYPDFVFCNNDKRQSIFHIAVENRHEKIFNLIHHHVIKVRVPSGIPDLESNNMLHLAGKLVPSNYIPGAALQMQRELQWFKAVEAVVHPALRERENGDKFGKKIPRDFFTDEHKALVKEGEDWTKNFASSCSVVASLVLTIMFAAAFTVPGGNDSNSGQPIFVGHVSFSIFMLADVLAFLSSATSIIIFLGMLTSRYSQDDFLESLPKKLVAGLVALYFSIATMIVAFAAGLDIVMSRRRKWIDIPLGILACVPVVLFERLQFPLLIEVYLSTYRPTILQHIKK